MNTEDQDAMTGVEMSPDNIGQVLPADVASEPVTTPVVEKPKNTKKWLWIALAGILVLILGIVVTFLIIKPGAQDSEADMGTSESDESVVNDEGASGIVLDGKDDVRVAKVSIQSDLVQNIYQRINVDGGPHAGLGRTYFWTDLLWNGGSDDVVLKIAFLNTVETPCKVTGRVYRWDDQYGGASEQRGVCKDGATIRQQMREIFGREVPVANGAQLSYSYTYDAQADEFWSFESGGGGGPVPSVKSELYDAEKDGESLYIYEYAATSCVIKVGSTLEEEGCKQIIDPQTEQHTVQWFQISDTKIQNSVWDSLAGERIIEMPIMGPYVEVDANGDYYGGWWDEVAAVKLSDYAQAVGRYKWTFRDDGTGNYVFVGLERI